MLEESELNTKEIGVDQILSRSSNEIVDGLLNRYDGVASNALNELQQKIEDGYTSKEILLAKQQLEDILEKSKNMSKTRQFMEELAKKFSIDEGNTLTDKEKDTEKMTKRLQLNTLIDNGIPPSVLLSNKELIFKTDLKNSDSKVEELEKQLSNPFLRASERAEKQKKLLDLKRNPNNFYIFRVAKVLPKEVVTTNYHEKGQPESLVFTFDELRDIINDPVNVGNAQKAYLHFPEDETPEQWKHTLWGDQEKVEKNFQYWLDTNKDKYDLHKYTKSQLNYLFKANVVYQHSMEQAINDLESKTNLHTIGDLAKGGRKKQDLFMPKVSLDDKPYLDKEESVIKEDSIVYRDSKNNDPENLQKMYDYLSSHGLRRDNLNKPFLVKNETDDLQKDGWYIITGTPYDSNHDLVRIAPIDSNNSLGEPIEISIDGLKYSMNDPKAMKYKSTSDHSIKNIEGIRKYLAQNDINSSFIDKPFIMKDKEASPKNKWAMKGNKNIFLPTEHRYVITGVPLNPNMNTLKVREILPTGMKGIEKELPIEDIKQAIANNEVDYNTMIDPRNGDVIDIPLDPKLRQYTYTHGVQGKFYPITRDNMIKMLELAQKLTNENGRPLYAIDLVQAYNYGKDTADLKNAIEDVWQLLGIQSPLEFKTVQGALQAYYTLGTARKRNDATSAMVKQARRKEGMF